MGEGFRCKNNYGVFQIDTDYQNLLMTRKVDGFFSGALALFTVDTSDASEVVAISSTTQFWKYSSTGLVGGGVRYVFQGRTTGGALTAFLFKVMSPGSAGSYGFRLRKKSRMVYDSNFKPLRVIGTYPKTPLPPGGGVFQRTEGFADSSRRLATIQNGTGYGYSSAYFPMDDLYIETTEITWIGQSGGNLIYTGTSDQVQSGSPISSGIFTGGSASGIVLDVTGY